MTTENHHDVDGAAGTTVCRPDQRPTDRQLPRECGFLIFPRCHSQWLWESLFLRTGWGGPGSALRNRHGVKETCLHVQDTGINVQLPCL